MTREEAEEEFIADGQRLSRDWSLKAQEEAEAKWQRINETLSEPIDLEALYTLRHFKQAQEEG